MSFRRTHGLLILGLLACAPTTSACFVRGGGGLFFALADTAILTAVIISATRPPPPRVVFVPEERPGYAWQPGYWTLHEGQWEWLDGGWVALQPGYAWAPAHWDETADQRWELVPGHWVPLSAVAAPRPYVPSTPPPPPQSNGPQYIPAPAPGSPQP